MLIENQDIITQIAYYKSLIKIEPLEIKNYDLLAEILFHSGDLDGALKCYEEATQNTKLWFFYNKLAEFLIKKHSFYEAAIKLNLSLKLNSYPNWWTHYLLGEVLANIGSLDLAIKSYQESISIEPKIYSYKSLLTVYLLQKKWSEAWELYCQASDLYPQENFWGIYHQYCDKKLVALTYDDGPNIKFTPPLLEILDKYQVKATFFVVGKNVEKNRKLAQLMLLKKHELANHSYSHINFVLEPEKISQEIQKTQAVLRQLGVKGTINFRSPFNKSSRQLFEYICHNKILSIACDTFPGDHIPENNSQIIFNNVMRRLQPGSIIALHDNNLRTLEATELIIKNLLSKGYSFMTVKDLLQFNVAKEVNDYPENMCIIY